MNRKHTLALLLAAACSLGSSLALADREGHGHGYGREDRDESRDERRDDSRYDPRFDRNNPEYDRRSYGRERHNAPTVIILGETHRRDVYDYYGPSFREGRCPPGLMRRDDGCVPPGQARHWHRGDRLPRNIAYYPVPRDLVVRLPPPPPGHRYVRVAGDILLITIGSAMVIDAIQDIGGY
jgi:Ni/Co efflux regulator RcnB